HPDPVPASLSGQLTLYYDPRSAHRGCDQHHQIGSTMISNLNPSAEAFLANMARVQQSVDQASRQVSSGLRVNSASDAPDEVAGILQLRTDAFRNTQLQSNLSLAKSDADAADNALNSATKLLDRARALGVQGFNFTQDADGRKSIAGEVESI